MNRGLLALTHIKVIRHSGDIYSYVQIWRKMKDLKGESALWSL